jgi:hypothetical protein
MVFGGLGIEGIQDTNFYRFITSAEGLSQLGIEPSEPPKLLDAYMDSIDAKVSGDVLEIIFGDGAKLKAGTPHPAAGTGHLQVESWMEWIIDKVHVGRGFVERSRLPERTQRSIRLGSPLGGLMLKRGQLGSLGSWEFPSRFINYDVEWLQNNQVNIQNAIIRRFSEILGT